MALTNILVFENIDLRGGCELESHPPIQANFVSHLKIYIYTHVCWRCEFCKSSCGNWILHFYFNIFSIFHLNLNSTSYTGLTTTLASKLNVYPYIIRNLSHFFIIEIFLSRQWFPWKWHTIYFLLIIFIKLYVCIFRFPLVNGILFGN